MKVNKNGNINMYDFELAVENISKEEFKKLILEFKDIRIDEKTNRVIKFDILNTNSTYENSVEEYLKELSNIKLLNLDELTALLCNIKKGDVVGREEILESSLKVIAEVALYYSKTGTSYLEIVQDGILGVVNAIENYDSKQSINFIDFMKLWIKYEIIQSNRQVIEDIKHPMMIYLKSAKVNMYMKEMKEQNRETDPVEIKKRLKMNIEEFENIQNIIDYEYIVEKKNSDLIKYNSIEEIDLELEKVSKNMNISNLANKFTTEEISILTLYYGFHGKRKYAEDISDLLNIKLFDVKERLKNIIVKLKYSGQKEWINEN